jgi:hypothetical protein
MSLKLVLLDNCWCLYANDSAVAFFESQYEAIDYVFANYKGDWSWTTI